EWSIGTIFRGMYDFMWIQCIAVALVLAFPGIAMWLPNYLEDSPPASVVPAGAEDAVERDQLEQGDAYKDEPAPSTASDSEDKSKEPGKRRGSRAARSRSRRRASLRGIPRACASPG